MDTVVTSLLSSDLFLIETPNYTGSISAQDINYISNQFPKIYSVIDSYSANARIVTSETLSVSSIAPFTAKTATLTGNFNTFILSSGLILSAYNTVSSEITAFSATFTTNLSILSASVFNVFFESGTARLTQLIHQKNVNGADQISLTGIKIAPAGLTIGAQDIQLKVLFNAGKMIDLVPNNTYVTYNTSFPFINLKDFDFSLANAFNGDFDDDGNDYIDSNTRKVVIPVSILNMPSNDILLAWKVQKFY